MRAPQTPSIQTTAKRHLKSSKNLHVKNTLNISRKILQKSICQQNRRVDTLQLNNVQLARKVSELQKELTQRDAELQVSREEAFQLRMKLNRLQNNTSESSLYMLRDILASMVEESFKAHQIASNACSKLTSAAACRASTVAEDSVALERSINMSFANIEATSPSTPCFEAAAEKPALSDVHLACDGPSSRTSSQSVDMDCDSFTRISASMGRLMDVVQATVPVPDDVVEMAPLTPKTGSSPESVLIPTSDDEYIPPPKKRGKKGANRKTRTRIKLEAHSPDKPCLTKTVYSLDSSSDHHFVESSRMAAVTMALEPREDAPHEPTLNTGEGTPKSATPPVSLESPEKVIVIDEPVISEAKPTSKLQYRNPKGKRKRLKLIADDSIFIPISDAMMVKPSEKGSALENENEPPGALERAPSTEIAPSRTSEKLKSANEPTQSPPERPSQKAKTRKRRPLSMMDDQIIPRIHQPERVAKPVLPPT